MSTIKEILKDLIDNRKDEIDLWFAEKYKTSRPFFYSSVDLRYSGHKLVPVDTNLFPAGFNLMTESAFNKGVTFAKQYLDKYYPDNKNIILVPENHTRNKFYLENVYCIKQLLENTGNNVVVAGLEVEGDQLLETASGKELIIKPLKRQDNIVYVDGFEADLIIVNNDFSSGAPDILKSITQPVVPPIGMGWYRRSKTHHFEVYNDLVRDFSRKFDFDHWLINSSINKCGTINFKDKKGLECVAINVEKTIRKIQSKYDEYGIKDEPYVFIKADAGTYGMGIMTVKSGEEAMELNKKNRKKMNAIKEGVQNTEVIIQEGIPTIDTVNGLTAEPMIYMVNGESIGCTYRVNESRDAYSNLNSAGMTFNSACEKDNEKESPDDMCPTQTLVAKLGSLAATQECYEPQWQI